MGEQAQEASDLALPEPVSIAVQQARRPDTPDGAKLRVFISYSRTDVAFAEQLASALNPCGFECLIDHHSIFGGEEWKQRLGNLISEVDTIIFVLSPKSARSKICTWEVEEAVRLNKRIIPIICQPLGGTNPPPRLRDLNYIPFHSDPNTPGSGFGNGLARLVAALSTDFDWVRKHSRYFQRATEWNAGGRPANRLLSGDDIVEAKAWAARRPKSAPEPMDLHLDFIRASEQEAEARSSEQRKQLEAMAAAQAEREKALREAEEALKQAADAQRKRARIRNIAVVVVVSLLAVVAGVFGWDAERVRGMAQLYLEQGVRAEQNRRDAEQQKETAEQNRRDAEKQKETAEQHRRNAEQQKEKAEQHRRDAEKQKERANTILYRATAIIVKSQKQMDNDTKKEVFGVFQTGAELGDQVSIRNLGFLYASGFGVRQDYTEARKWYEKAAAMGDEIAIEELAQFYGQGHGVRQDYAKERELHEKAAALGDARAMVNLALIYEDGRGVPQDRATAREWYEKVVAEGKDPAKAREWLEWAAAKGSVEAKTALRSLNDRGETQEPANSVQVDPKLGPAREPSGKATAKGNKNARFRPLSTASHAAFWRWGDHLAIEVSPAAHRATAWARW
jgi:TPR repeat protein